MPEVVETLHGILDAFLSGDSQIAVEIPESLFPPPHEGVIAAVSVLRSLLRDGVFGELLRVSVQSSDPPAALIGFAELAEKAPSSLVELGPEQLSAVSKLLSGGEFLCERLFRNAEHLQGIVDAGQHTFTATHLREEIAAWESCSPNWPAVRQWHDRHLLRIALADCAGWLDILDVAEQLSILADVTINAVARAHARALTGRYGRPVQDDGAPATWCILGLGKLGGSELNFRSDVDVLFIYSADGHSTGGTSPAVSVAEWYTRWAESVIATLTEVSEDGILYRVDTRLRPDGGSGALVRSVASYEHYYEKRGEIWERQMLIKARPIAGTASTGEELLGFLEPFIYPRTFTRSPREEIHRVKNRILQHIAARSAPGLGSGEVRNLKLRRGGLRDIEFIAQCLQLVVGGTDRILRQRSCIAALQRLGERRVLGETEVVSLISAYRFYRRIEHRLQMATGQASFALPGAPDGQTLLSRRLGFTDLARFFDELDRARRDVIAVYDNVLGPPENPDDTIRLLELPAGSAAAVELIAPFGFRFAENAHRDILHLAFGHDEARAPTTPPPQIVRLLPKLLAGLAENANPDRALRNLERMLSAFGAVDSFADLLSSHNSLLELLLTLGGRSQSLTDTVVRDPGLVDWMLYSGVLLASRTPEEIELVVRASVSGLSSIDERIYAVRAFKKRENLRIGSRYLLGLASEAQTCAQLTAVADATIRQVARCAAEDVVQRNSGVAVSGWAVIGLGKLGGKEMNFGSDLDLVFVHDDEAADFKVGDSQTAFAQWVVRVLSSNTDEGMLYEVDTRLRPEGRHGPITMSLSGYRSYFISRASPWERQALTRARIITSSGGMEERITTCIADAVYLEAPGQILEGVADMRLRMQGESEKKYGAQQNIKTGEGGLVDAEFIAQVGQLLFGTGIPGLMGADTPAALERLGNYGTLGKGTATGLREAYEELRRVQINLRIDDDRAHNVLPVDEEAALTLARGLGFDSIANLQEHVSGVAKKMRECFLIALEELRRTAT